MGIFLFKIDRRARYFKNSVFNLAPYLLLLGKNDIGQSSEVSRLVTHLLVNKVSIINFISKFLIGSQDFIL